MRGGGTGGLLQNVYSFVFSLVNLLSFLESRASRSLAALWRVAGQGRDLDLLF